MASKESNAIKELYDSWTARMEANPDMQLDELREMLEHWGDLTPEPGGIDYIEEECSGIPCIWAVPKNAHVDRVLICCHGGGYVSGSIYSHRKLYAHLAKAIGCRALIFDYRLAPEFTHPAQVEDAVRVYEWLIMQGIKPEHIATTGDSAGGALCTSMLISIRDRDLPLPAAAMPMSPYYDLEFIGNSMDSNEGIDRMTSRRVVIPMAKLFLGGESARDPLANPLHADIRGLPPFYIQVGGDETLLDDALRFEKKAELAGIEIRVDVYPEMQHVFQFMAGAAEEADRAITQMAEWARWKLDLPV